MAYSQLGITNLALGRIGVKRITDIDPAVDTSTQAADADAVWEYIRDEVLEDKDWVFAKKRVALPQSFQTPWSGFDYAYILPSDFLRLARQDDNDPPVYPSGYNYKFEEQDIVADEGTISDFDPAPGYSVGADARVGKYRTLNFGSSKYLYIAATYKQEGAAGIKIVLETAADDTLAVSDSNDTITISLANATSSKNAANLIQVALRALAEVNDIDVSEWTVTENAAYAAARPIIGEDSAVAMADGDKVYDCILQVAASATNTSYFPPVETTYWTEIDATITRVLVTDYDDVGGEVIIKYIRRVTDVTKYTAIFINAFAWRLAAELSILRKEARKDFNDCMKIYGIALDRADALNQASDYLEDETGNDDWETAGR